MKTTRILLSFALAIGIGTFVGGCGSDNPGSTADTVDSPRTAQQPSPAPSVQPTYSSIAANILQPSCIRCHGASSPAGGISLTTYDALVSGSAVIPGDPEHSPLYQLTQSGAMPPTGNKLSTQQIQAIHDWIAQGAKNN